MKKILIIALLFLASSVHAQVWRWDFYAPNGSLVSANGSNPVVALPQGASGQVLTSAGLGNAPTWGLPNSSVVLNADSATTGQALIGSPLQFTAGANYRYSIDGQIIATSSAATGIKFGIRIPAGDTCYVVFNGTDTTTLQSNVTAVTADSGLTAVYGQLNGTCYATFKGVVSGPTAGPVILGFLKGTSGTATLKKWSTFTWKRIY